MKLLKYLILSICCLTFSQSIYSQSKKDIYNETTVELHNGSLIKGKLIELNDDIVKISIVGGSVFVYPRSEVKSIETSPKKIYTIVNVFDYNREGMYYALHGNLSGNANDGGIGLSGIVGYQYNNYLAAGVGMSFNQISVVEGIQTVPFFLEARGHLVKGPVSPYYSLAAGYGIAIPNSQFDVIEAKGGFMWHPAFGMRFDRFTGSAFLVDVGYHFQNAEITTQGFGGINIDDIQYRRFTVRLGWVF